MLVLPIVMMVVVAAVIAMGVVMMMHGRRRGRLWMLPGLVVTVLGVLGFLTIAFLFFLGWAWGMEAKRAGVLAEMLLLAFGTTCP